MLGILVQSCSWVKTRWVTHVTYWILHWKWKTLVVWIYFNAIVKLKDHWSWTIMRLETLFHCVGFHPVPEMLPACSHVPVFSLEIVLCKANAWFLIIYVLLRNHSPREFFHNSPVWTALHSLPHHLWINLTIICFVNYVFIVCKFSAFSTAVSTIKKALWIFTDRKNGRK